MLNTRAIRNIRLGIKTLLLHKMQSILTVLGVVFGVASVIAMLSVGEGASQEALEQIRKLGSNIIVLSASKPAEDEAPNQQRSHMSVYGLTYADDLRIRNTIPTVTRTVPAKIVRKQASLGSQTLELRIVGTTADWFSLLKREVLAGRVLQLDDIQHRRAVCILTEHGARKLLATRHSVGETIRIGSDRYVIVGIVRNETAASGVQIPDQEIDAYIPITVARERHGDLILQASTGSFQLENVELHKILIEVDSTDNVKAAAESIMTMLKRAHKNKDYKQYVPLALLEQTANTKRMFSIVLASIAGISLLVGGIGIMNIMLASVTERTREIGIRRAIGARRSQIIGQFLIETVVLSFVGGLLGTAIGILLPLLITAYSGMPTVVPIYSIVLSLGISLAIGVIFGLYPAIRAARLDPIEALRHE